MERERGKERREEDDMSKQTEKEKSLCFCPPAAYSSIPKMMLMIIYLPKATENSH